jgi:hypothetical protein
MEPVTIAAFVVAIVTAISTLIAHLHLRKCNIFGKCCQSDCTPKTPPDTPINPQVYESSI